MLVERWTIDELTDTTVTLLRTPSTTSVEWPIQPHDEEPYFLWEVLERENSRSPSWDSTWFSEDFVALLDRSRFQPFVDRQLRFLFALDPESKSGFQPLPRQRAALNRDLQHEESEPWPLGEGDVYWMVYSSPVPFEPDPVGVESTDLFLLAYETYGNTEQSYMIDVTAVAREYAAELYHSLLVFAAEPRGKEREYRATDT